MLLANKAPIFAVIILFVSPLFAMDKITRVPFAPPAHPSYLFNHNANERAPLLLTTESAAAEPNIQEPARKRLRADNPTPQTAAFAAFQEPYTLAQICRRIGHQDVNNFECVSRACTTASHLKRRPTREFIARQLLESTNNPIRHVLREAQGKESVVIDGFTYNTEKLIQTLQKKTSILDEAIVNFTNPATYSPNANRPKIPVARAIEQKLSLDELQSLKAIKFHEIDYHEGITEDQIVEQIRLLDDKESVLELKIKPAEGTAPAEIRQSLMNKLANINITTSGQMTPNPIVALTVEHEQFPEGLACLARLRQLRCLSIEHCGLPEDAVLPDELCTDLPLLTVLRVIESGPTEISQHIGSLQHLRVLEFDEEISTLPASLHNLKKLKIFSLSQESSLPPEAILCLPSMDGIKVLDLPDMGDKSNPIPESSSMEQLTSLTLTETIEPLIHNPEKFKKLKSLDLIISYPEFTFPPCIASLPSLRNLMGSVPDDTLIPYAALQSIAKNLQYCSLFTNDTDSIGEIRKAADLWQFIQTNGDLISRKIRLRDYSIFYKGEIDTFKLLYYQTITAYDLQLLTDNNAASVIACSNFVHSLLETTFKSGRDECDVIMRRLNHPDKKLASTLSQIIRVLCEDIPAHYDFSNGGNIDGHPRRQLPDSIVELVYNFASATNTIMKDIIGKGITLGNEQFDNCMMNLKFCARTDHCVSYCKNLLVDLFFHHAVECNNFTNAQILLTRYKASLNSRMLSTGDTPLHTAIRNREATNDPIAQQSIDNLIYFLVKNGADTERRNCNDQTPLQLIAPTSSLHQLINSWRTACLHR